MAFGQIDDVDIVSDAGAVRSRIVVPEHVQFRADAHSDLSDVGHQVVGDATGFFADQTGRMGPDGIEIAKEHDRQVRISHAGVFQDLFDHEFGPSIGVGASERAGLFGIRHFLRQAVDRR